MPGNNCMSLNPIASSLPMTWRVCREIGVFGSGKDGTDAEACSYLSYSLDKRVATCSRDLRRDPKPSLANE